MATVRNGSLTMNVGAGVVTVTAFYDDTNGRPVRVDTVNTSGRPYQIRLRTADGSRQIAAVIQAGTNSVNVPANVGQRIDMRPYEDENGDPITPGNPTSWVMECWI